MNEAKLAFDHLIVQPSPINSTTKRTIIILIMEIAKTAMSLPQPSMRIITPMLQCDVV